MIRSGNPALKESTFLDLGSGTVVSRDAGAMTLNGTVNKTGILLLLSVLTAAFAWTQSVVTDPDGTAMVAPGVTIYALGGAIGGFILAMVTVFKKTWSPVTAPLYALVEGFFLGAISAVFELKYPGIVFQAVVLTFGTLGALLAAYRSGLIRATENFKLGVVAATGGIALVYLVSMGLRLFGKDIPLIHESGLVGIGFSLFVVVIAALNLVLDFDFIESGVEAGAPKYMEWYGAFGLMVTLVWLYIEFLRLLAKLQSRD
ncbi:Bax inhibitor-1/YccA family protein [Pseudoxanthomonas mexicana]|uniref:Bax inhibitor-1/YccA family protein n=1 Tax=Pseudoxanthomonas mexicana TaxID=128785 RepID=UPI0028BE5D68|nr:Bax inhibitor-1/YccA family protein [Pseudoxanthomonas mexicana]